MQRTKVVDALQCTNFGEDINVKGWVRSHRSSKAVDFIALNDGSTIKNVQVVVNPADIDAEKLKSITTGSCISVVGKLVQSQGKGQAVEIQSREIEIYGTCPSRLSYAEEGSEF
jgi:asparaginyl-tRNA synthetase